ncbi:MAG TPA: SDR family oxidoreductase [Gammaproteobacteria bacterium]|nr:SDR family oxidoreductase [Gammaproteobacteria bacterium]
MTANQSPSVVNKVALVTGGARRVGRAVALKLAEAGMNVAITYQRSREEAAEVVARIEALGRRGLAIAADLSQPDADAVIASALMAGFERLDALINNASSFAPTPWGKVGAADYDLNQAVNARAPLRLIQRFAPLLGAHHDSRDPDSAGRVVNFIDIHVMGEPLKHYLAYNASKAALMEITSSCAIELAPRVTVNAIAPGVIEWAESYTEAERRAYMTRVPLGRPGTPEDAARAVLFLVRDASYCTGQILRLDGGRFLT